VQSLVDDGKISEAEAAVHPHRSLLLKVLNGQPLSEPDLTRVPVQAGDRLLFCSDGLCGLVGDDDLADALRVADPQRCLRQLVADAHAEGGIDNITIVLADVVEGEAVVSGDTVEAVVLGAAAERAVPPPPGRAAAGAAAGTPGAAAPRGATAVGAGAGRLGGHDDESRYNPQPPHQRRLLRPLVGLLVVLLVLGTAVGTAYAWGRTQYYVGAQAEQVAIFQGLPERVVVPLSRVFEVQSLAISDLPPYYADQVHAGIEVASLASARETVAQLREAVQRCNATTPSPSPSPKPGVTPRRAPPTKAGPVRSPTPVRPEDPPTSSTPTPIPTPPPTPPAGPGC
jgi:protein phosphatase